MGNAEGNSSVLSYSNRSLGMNTLGYRPVTSTILNQPRSSTSIEARKFPERVPRDTSSSGIRGEIMTIHSPAWKVRSSSSCSPDQLEIIDLSIGEKKTDQMRRSIQRFREREHSSPEPEDSTPQDSRDSDERGASKIQPRLKFGIDSILAGSSSTKERDPAFSRHSFNKAAMETSSDYSSDDGKPRSDREGSVSPEHQGIASEAVQNILREWNPQRHARGSSQHFEAFLKGSLGNSFKFHPYHQSNGHSSLTRNQSDPLPRSGQQSPRERRKSESPKLRAMAGHPSPDRREESRRSFVEVRRHEKRQSELEPIFTYAPKRQSLDALSSPSQIKGESLCKFAYPCSTQNPSTVFRRVSDSDVVFREDARNFLRLPPRFGLDSQANENRLSRGSWRPCESESKRSSPPQDIFKSPGNSRVEPFLRSNACLSPSSTSPSTPHQMTLQTWQALTANCHPSLRHLLYPYAFGGNAAATAMALAAVRSQLKATSHQSFGRLPATSPSPISPPAEEEKRKMPKKRRKWSRAVFSLMQRRGLEKSFQVQKYVAKPERRGLAEALGLTDAQVKIWFQNRRMKWRQELKNTEKQNPSDEAARSTTPGSVEEHPHGQLASVAKGLEDESEAPYYKDLAGVRPS